MKIAFIEPSVLSVEPLGIAYLAQMLVDNGHSVRYFEMPRRHSLERLKEFGPDVLAFSATTGKHRICRELNAHLRSEINAMSIFGGPHCTFYPQFIETSPLIDGVCQGEGEHAIVDLINKLQNGQDYSEIDNWWVRIGSDIHRNEVRNKIEDLDAIPFPNRDVIYLENKELLHSPIKRILTSRGCPFRCSYCFNKRYNSIYKDKGKVYRTHSVSRIIQEVKSIKDNYNFTFLKMVDDNFQLNSDCKEFAEQYKREINIPFLCNIRPNSISDEKIKNLKKGGCAAVTMAIESGNSFIRNEILHRDLSEDVMDKAINIVKNNGIKIWTQNIIGNPSETFEMALETYNFNVRHKIDFAECFLLTPYPGTEVYHYCKKNNLLKEDITIEKLPRSYWLTSSIKLASEKDRRKFENFHKLFPFSVRHPGFFPLAKGLIKLPPNVFFVIFSRIYDVWRIGRLIKVKFTAYSLFLVVKVNLRFISNFFVKAQRGKS